MSTDTQAPKFPDVVVNLGDLSGPAGNAFAVMGNVTAALRRAKKGQEAITEYTNAAMSGDYNDLLRVTMETVTVVVPRGGYDLVTSVDSLIPGQDDESDDLYDDSDWDRD